MVDEETPEPESFLFGRPAFGKRASFADLKKTLWPNLKHDPKDTTSKDWANSEPDPNAP